MSYSTRIITAPYSLFYPPPFLPGILTHRFIGTIHDSSRTAGILHQWGSGGDGGGGVGGGFPFHAHLFSHPDSARYRVKKTSLAV